MELSWILLLAASVIVACVVSNRITSKLGVPMLLAFILLGMLFGSDGLAKIPFDNYGFANEICSVALIFIMFYGGFGTKWSEAKPVAVRAVLLSSAGTVLTAGLVGLFCRFALRIDWLESFLIGSVIASTDAASVFSILRSKRLNLRYRTASLLEVESGSNDPFSYMLTVIMLSLMHGNVTAGGFVYMLFAQIVFGVGIGLVVAGAAVLFLKRFRFSTSGFDAIFIVAVALLSYAIPSVCGGNGYLSAYLTGIVLGNQRLENKQSLVHFFDGMTGLMQMVLFFLLGLLSFPSKLPQVALPALLIALFLTFVARPAAVFALLSPFRSKIRQQILISWAGMRGAASIVFAILVVTGSVSTQNDIFHIVFFIVLFSILLQGTLLPLVSKKLGMTDDESDVMKTFTDYSDRVPVQFIQFSVSEHHPWANRMVSEIILPPDCILVLLIRDGEKIVPKGKTRVVSGDVLILSGRATERIDGIHLYEKTIHRGDEWLGKMISELPSHSQLVIMIQRAGNVIIPRGTTILREKDILVINDPDSESGYNGSI